jgi:hypothetical protein
MPQPAANPQSYDVVRLFLDLLITFIAGIILFGSLVRYLTIGIDSLVPISASGTTSPTGLVLFLAGLLLFFLIPAVAVTIFRWKKNHVFSWGALSAVVVGCLFLVWFAWGLSLVMHDL